MALSLGEPEVDDQLPLNQIGSVPLSGRGVAPFGIFVYNVLMGTKHIGELEQMVLLAIARLGPDAYGMAVLRELEGRADRVVSRGALYLVLERMVQKGYLSTRLGEPTPGRGGRAKRFFELTEVGREALRICGRSLFALWEDMDFLLEEGS